MTKARDIADLGSNDVLDTTASGVSVTGEVASDTLTINGGTNFTAPIEFMGNDTNWAVAVQNGTTTGASYGLVVRAGTNTNDISFETRDADNNKSFRVLGNGDITMYKDDGTTSGFEFDASTANVTVNGDIQLTETGDTTQSLTFQQVGGASFIKPKSGSNDGELYISGGQTATNRMKVTTGGDIIMYKSDGSTAGFTWDASEGTLNLASGSTTYDALKITGNGGNNFIHMVGNQGQTSFKMYENGSDDPAYFQMFNAGTIQHSFESINGGSIVFNEQGLDIDFRVESDSTAGMLFVDGGNNAVGVGTTLTNATFAVMKTDASNPTIRVYGDNSAGDDASIRYQAQDTGGTNRYCDMVFDADIDSTGGLKILTDYGYDSEDENIRFSNSGTVVNEGGGDKDFRVESDSNTHALFLQGSDGNLGIRNSSPEEAIHLNDGVVRIDRASGSVFNVWKTTDTDQEMRLQYYHQDSESFGAQGSLHFKHYAAGTEDTSALSANVLNAQDTIRVAGIKTKPILQVLYIDSSTSTNINNTSWNAVTGTVRTVTISKTDTMRMYDVTIPGEIDSDAGNVFAQVYRSVNGGGYSAVGNITNLNFPSGVSNGTVNSTVRYLDTTSYSAGTTVAYQVYVKVQNSSAGLELGQNNLSGNSPGNNNMQGFLLEIDDSD